MLADGRKKKVILAFRQYEFFTVPEGHFKTHPRGERETNRKGPQTNLFGFPFTRHREQTCIFPIYFIDMIS